MLPVCSAAPTCSSPSPISFHVGARAFCPLRKVIEDRCIAEDRSFFSTQDVIRAQGIKTHAIKCMHSLSFERPDQSSSLNSSIFSSYPNELDEIAHRFSNDYLDPVSENWRNYGHEINRSYPVAGDIKYVESLNISGPEVQHGDFGSDAINEVSSYHALAERFNSSYVELKSSASPSEDDLVNLLDTHGHSSNALFEPTFGTLSAPNPTTNTIAEGPMPISDTFEVTNKGLPNLKESIEHFLSGINESVGTSMDRVEAVGKSTFNAFTSTASDSLKSVTKSFDSLVSDLFSSVDSAKELSSDELSGLSRKVQESMSGTGTLAIDILRQAVVALEDYLGNAATFVVYFYGSAKSLLPLNVRDVLNLSEERLTEILMPVGAAFQQVYIVIEGFEKTLGLDPNDPIAPFIIFLGTASTIGISFWLFIYGGYSGDLTPEITLKLLKNEENAVLIDVRPEDLRRRDGIPDLRRGARSKYASVILPEVDASLRKMLKTRKEIDDALTAVVIRNLKAVQDGSRVIVMDDSGGRSKAIARSLKKLGVKKPYLVHGGFQSWVKKGLRVKELKPESSLTILSEEAEAILEDIKPTPALVIGYGLGISAAIYALLEWEKTLQVIGIIGLGQTLYRRVASYEDSEGLKQDVRLLLAPLRMGSQAFSWAAKKLEPNKIGLPTSPLSTAVQGRVLQAAAKHESQPSDFEESLGPPRESSGQTSENLDLSEA